MVDPTLDQLIARLKNELTPFDTSHDAEFPELSLSETFVYGRATLAALMHLREVDRGLGAIEAKVVREFAAWLDALSPGQTDADFPTSIPERAESFLAERAARADSPPSHP